MNSILISLIPTFLLLRLGATLWCTDPWVRAQRAVARSSMCVGCGKYHTRRNACSNTFDAFCTDDCFDETMEDLVS
jgi:hypothetical protein